MNEESKPAPIDTAPSFQHQAEESVRRAEIQAFIDQARWLLQWHESRSAGVTSRAVSTLGFAGVILALIPAGAASIDTRRHAGLEVALVLSCGALVTSAVLCLLVLAPMPSGAPQIRQLRTQWAEFLAMMAAGSPGQSAIEANIAESLLHGSIIDGMSPLDLAKQEADRRAGLFRWATVALLVAVAGIAVLVLESVWG